MARKGKPTQRFSSLLSYRVICISMYLNDLAHMDLMVERLKRRGLTKINRSMLIRYALKQPGLEESALQDLK